MTEPLPEARNRLRSALSPATTVERITIGDRVVLVEVAGSAGKTAGLAHRPEGEPPSTEQLDVERLLEAATRDPENAADRLERALGIATMNALSAPAIDWQTGDPMALLDDDVDRIVTVGLFGPAFRKFDDVEVRVIEREPLDDVSVQTPEGVRVRTFTPAETDAAMADAEVVFVTGSAFIYGGVGRYLAAAPADATVIVIGATASFLPAPLFAAGVDVVAGASVTDVESVREAVEAGACGTDLHDAGVAKVYVAAERTAGVRLETTIEDEPTNL
ncbi:Rossmann-like domain-containing protein [Halobellus marinus]|uniref:Rossmann-like domain-containing protein n=1 Tax=Halobellus TaxID=1073986 RepID=UPI0028A7CFF4|nr:DUF364 domain-containing protein [Halobellus sp. DFY28]